MAKLQIDGVDIAELDTETALGLLRLAGQAEGLQMASATINAMHRPSQTAESRHPWAELTQRERVDVEFSLTFYSSHSHKIRYDTLHEYVR